MPWPWIFFNLFVLAMLALDLGVFHRKSHVISVREATIWSSVWITISMIFNVILFFWKGPTPALEFLAGYLIEKSLSVDNIFVFVIIFGSFAVPREHQHRVLFWGVIGALIMRGILIGLGAILLQRFHWLIYVFGAFLIFTGIRLLGREGEEPHPEKSPLIQMLRRVLPMTGQYHGKHFFVREGGRFLATPLLLVLVIVEVSDLIFAFDSIPAIFAVTSDPFLVFTSNIFAILGLRSLYFLLAGVIKKFHYLEVGLSFILIFVGVKMVIAPWIKIPITASLGVIATILLLAIIASLRRARRLQANGTGTEDPPTTIQTDRS